MVGAEGCRPRPRPENLDVMTETGPNYSRTPSAQQEVGSSTELDHDVDLSHLARSADSTEFRSTGIGMY